MLKDFGGERVFLLRDVPSLLEQRQVTIRFNVALRAGIAVPVPSPAKVGAVLDDANVVQPRLAQSRARDETAPTASDDNDVDFIGAY